MNRALILTVLTIAMTSGSAFADHHHGGGWHNNGGGHARGSWNGGGWSRGGAWSGGGWSGGVVVRSSPVRVIEPRVIVRPRFVRRPVVVVQSAPVIVQQQPPSQVWIEGRWNWTGYEWSWLPGHYEYSGNYDQGYVQSSYAQPSYDATYGASYDTGYSQPPCDD